MAKQEFKIVKRGDGRYSVKKRGGGYVHGEEKTKVLQAKNLVKVMKAKAKPAAEATEA